MTLQTRNLIGLSVAVIIERNLVGKRLVIFLVRETAWILYPKSPPIKSCVPRVTTFSWVNCYFYLFYRSKKLRPSGSLYRMINPDCTLRKIGWECAARLPNALPYTWFETKIRDFPNFIYDMTTNSRPDPWINNLFQTYLSSLIQTDVKGIVKGFCWLSCQYNGKIASSKRPSQFKTHTLFETKLQSQ